MLLVKDILKKIETKEQVNDYRQIPQNRWLQFNNARYISQHLSFDDSESDFKKFHDYLKTLVFTQSDVYKNVAINVLTRGFYI